MFLDAWKKEDLARCLLNNILDDIAGEVLNTCARHKIKRVFFIGSLLNTQFARDEFMKCIGLRQTYITEVSSSIISLQLISWYL
jgi:hypothetical protein